jgi:hypothetical protein
MSLKVSQSYSGEADSDVLTFGLSVVSNMNHNLRFENLPVDLATLQSDLEKFSTVIVESLDGSKRVLAEKTKLRQSIIKRLRLLGHFVEATCNDDPAAVMSSGYQTVTVTRRPPQRLATPAISRIDHGASGQLLVLIAGVAKARSYEIRFAPVVGGTPAMWATEATTTVQSAIPIDGLTPGTVYTFQVRALGRLGFTAWSDSANCMCT